LANPPAKPGPAAPLRSTQRPPGPDVASTPAPAAHPAPSPTTDELTLQRQRVEQDALSKLLLEVDDVVARLREVRLRVPGRMSVTRAHMIYSSLLAILDVVYGAVISYGLFLIAQRISTIVGAGFPVDFSNPWYPQVRDFVWTYSHGRLYAIVFISYLALCIGIENRVHNQAFPYRGRGRFVLELTLIGLWFLAFITAEQGSSSTFLFLASSFVARGIWCGMLSYDIRDRFDWKWPQLVAVANIAYFLVIGSLFLTYRAQLDIEPRAVAFAWISWISWTLILLGIRRHFKIEAAEADLLPIGSLHLIVSKIWVVIRGGIRLAVNWFSDFVKGGAK
jgi:hypothetical protein